MKQESFEKELGTVSAIIPVYNTSTFLDQCLNSIIEQSYRDIEVVIIDDGSLDSGSALCDVYTLSDSRVIVLHENNAGVAKARKNGLDISTGEFFSFIDSDDYVKSDYFEVLLRALIKHEVDWVSSNFIYDRLDKESGLKEICVNKLIEDPSIHLNNYLNHFTYMGVVCGKLFSRKIGEMYIVHNQKIGEDTCTLIDFVINKPRSYLMSYSGYYYVNRDNSITRDEQFGIKDFDRWSTFKYIYNVVKDKFPELANDFNDIMICKLISLYQETLRNKKAANIETINKKVKKEVLEIKICDNTINTRLKCHLFAIKYLNHVYNTMVLVKKCVGNAPMSVWVDIR